MSTSKSPTPTLPTAGPVNRHAPTAVERQRAQLDKLLKDPAKPAYVPAPPKEKTIRPPREMMKNVQGSSAGAGSGEFHVYKASRRRENERLKLLSETAQKELEEAEFERKRKQAEDLAEIKTAKNRAKRQKKKERSKAKGSNGESGVNNEKADAPIKKRRLVNGKELVFKVPGEESDEESQDQDPQPSHPTEDDTQDQPVEDLPRIVESPRIVIHEDD